MAVPAIGVCRMVLDWSGPKGQLINNVLHASYDLAGSGDPQDLLDLVGDMWTANWGPLDPEISDSVSLGQALVYVWNAVTQLWDPVGPAVIGRTGGSITAILPHQVSGLINLITDDPRVDGRIFLYGLNVLTNSATGTMKASTQTALLNWIAYYLNTHVMGTREITLGVWSQKLKTLVDVFGALVDDEWSTQRKRRPGTGA